MTEDFDEIIQVLKLSCKEISQLIKTKNLLHLVQKRK